MWCNCKDGIGSWGGGDDHWEGDECKTTFCILLFNALVKTEQVHLFLSLTVMMMSNCFYSWCCCYCKSNGVCQLQERYVTVCMVWKTVGEERTENLGFEERENIMNESNWNAKLTSQVKMSFERTHILRLSNFFLLHTRFTLCSFSFFS